MIDKSESEYEDPLHKAWSEYLKNFDEHDHYGDPDVPRSEGMYLEVEEDAENE